MSMGESSYSPPSLPPNRQLTAPSISDHDALAEKMKRWRALLTSKKDYFHAESSHNEQTNERYSNLPSLVANIQNRPSETIFLPNLASKSSGLGSTAASPTINHTSTNSTSSPVDATTSDENFEDIMRRSSSSSDAASSATKSRNRNTFTISEDECEEVSEIARRGAATTRNHTQLGNTCEAHQLTDNNTNTNRLDDIRLKGKLDRLSERYQENFEYGSHSLHHPYLQPKSPELETHQHHQQLLPEHNSFPERQIFEQSPKNNFYKKCLPKTPSNCGNNKNNNNNNNNNNNININNINNNNNYINNANTNNYIDEGFINNSSSSNLIDTSFTRCNPAVSSNNNSTQGSQLSKFQKKLAFFKQQTPSENEQHLNSNQFHDPQHSYRCKTDRSSSNRNHLDVSGSSTNAGGSDSYKHTTSHTMISNSSKTITTTTPTTASSAINNSRLFFERAASNTSSNYNRSSLLATKQSNQKIINSSDLNEHNNNNDIINNNKNNNNDDITYYKSRFSNNINTNNKTNINNNNNKADNPDDINDLKSINSYTANSGHNNDRFQNSLDITQSYNISNCEKSNNELSSPNSPTEQNRTNCTETHFYDDNEDEVAFKGKKFESMEEQNDESFKSDDSRKSLYNEKIPASHSTNEELDRELYTNQEVGNPTCEDNSYYPHHRHHHHHQQQQQQQQQRKQQQTQQKPRSSSVSSSLSRTPTTSRTSTTSTTTSTTVTSTQTPKQQKTPKLTPSTLQRIQGAFSKISNKVFHSGGSANKKTYDERMIEILLTKKEREEMEKKEREMAHKIWEAEKMELSSFKRRNSYGGTGTRKELNKPRTAFHEKQQANKHSVEQRLEHQRLEFEEYQRQLKMKHENDFQRVNSLRTSKSQQNLLKTKLKSLQSEQKQESISQQNRKSMENLSQLKKNIDAKLQTAEQNALMKKEDSKKSKEDLHSRAEQSRLRVLQLEEEMRMYQMELLQFNEKQLQHADHLAKRRLAEKKEAACKERLEKEKIHRNNYKRLAEEEDRRNAEMERMIASKDLKVELLMKEKQEAIARNRAKAQASQMMREQVRNSSSLQTTVKRLNDLQERQQHLFNYTYTSNNNNNNSSLYYQQPQPKKLGNGSSRSSETNSLFSYAISPSQQQNQRNTYTESSKNIDDSYNFDPSDDANDTLTFRNNSLKYTRDGCDDYEDQNVDDDLNDYDLNAFNDDVSYR